MNITLEARALRILPQHIGNLHLITDDLPAFYILLECKDRLLDRADNLPHTQEEQNHEARKP